MGEEVIFGMDMTVFKGMPGKRVGVQPYDIDGNVLYTIKCKKTSGTQSNWMAITGPQLQVKINKKAMRLMAQLIKFYYLLYLNKE